MYKIQRNAGKVVITDWNDKIIYSVSGDSLVLYKDNVSQGIATAKVSELSDQQLLTALANAVKLSL